MQVLLKRFYTFLALVLLAFYALYHASLLHGHMSSVLDVRREQLEEEAGENALPWFFHSLACNFSLACKLHTA
jgi:hypothetical protein